MVGFQSGTLLQNFESCFNTACIHSPCLHTQQPTSSNPGLPFYVQHQRLVGQHIGLEPNAQLITPH
jgi:hypothetical protein